MPYVPHVCSYCSDSTFGQFPLTVFYSQSSLALCLPLCSLCPHVYAYICLIVHATVGLAIYLLVSIVLMFSFSTLVQSCLVPVQSLSSPWQPLPEHSR